MANHQVTKTRSGKKLHANALLKIPAKPVHLAQLTICFYSMVSTLKKITDDYERFSLLMVQAEHYGVVPHLPKPPVKKK